MSQVVKGVDIQALAGVLDGFGISLGLVGADNRVQPLVAAGSLQHPPAPRHGSRVATLTLPDGRRLVVTERDRRPERAGRASHHSANVGTLADAAGSAGSAGSAEAAEASPADHPHAGPAPLLVPERRASGPAGDLRFRLLAEHSIDLIVAVDADLAIRYASPIARSMLGCEPGALHGRTLAELLAPEDRAAFITRHFTQVARRGNGPDLFRALRPDGSTLWVEARVAALPPGNGLGDYLVTLRDATRRKLNEDALGVANEELSALASTDALTSLPNRRQFDATLSKEWYRALREAAPLALLMIDVDRFKSLNDRFGHPVGDAFLARVGRVIRDNVRRAGDLAARYGGEEFAVILPGTLSTGALDIAEHIRRAVAATDTRNIVAGGYPLSVSIGVAALVPLAGGGSAALIHSADAALYQAKRSGRNRVELMQ